MLQLFAMSTLIPPAQLTAEDVERASERDGKLYELIDGELKEKRVGFLSLFIAGRIIQQLNTQLYPREGVAAGEVMVYCFARRRHGRKPDVVYVRRERLPGGAIPHGDIDFVPDLVVEVLSPGNSGIEVEEKLDEYLDAGVPLVWIVNPERRTIRVYRSDGTTHLFRGQDAIENEPLLPGFRLVASDVFPDAPA
jgi:Uma2 family endonuclease